MGLSHVPDEQIPVLLLRLIADKGTPARLRCPEVYNFHPQIYFVLISIIIFSQGLCRRNY
jgi:hypothetical protein